MAKEAHYYTKFEYDCFYHVYNRSIDLKPMFKSRDNYLYFLKRYNDFLSEVVDTYAYNLLGNHFHLCIKIKSETDIAAFVEENKIYKEKPIHEIIRSQLKRFFQSYALAFNKQHNRIDTLFQKPFKRALLDHNNYIQNTITYIHQNAQHHGLVDDFRDWEWSSYNSMISEKDTRLKRDELLQNFEGKSSFETAHNVTIKDRIFWEIEW